MWLYASARVFCDARPQTASVRRNRSNIRLWTITWATRLTSTPGSGSRKAWRRRLPARMMSAPAQTGRATIRLSWPSTAWEEFTHPLGSLHQARVLPSLAFRPSCDAPQGAGSPLQISHSGNWGIWLKAQHVGRHFSCTVSMSTIRDNWNVLAEGLMKKTRGKITGTTGWENNKAKCTVHVPLKPRPEWRRWVKTCFISWR